MLRLKNAAHLYTDAIQKVNHERCRLQICFIWRSTCPAEHVEQPNGLDKDHVMIR